MLCFGAKKIFLTYLFSLGKSAWDPVKKSAKRAANATGNKKLVFRNPCVSCLMLVQLYHAWWSCVVLLLIFEHEHTDEAIWPFPCV